MKFSKVVFALFALCAVLTGCERFSGSKILLHPQKTGITTLNFIDESRQRPLVTEVWYPVSDHVEAKNATGVWERCMEARNAPIEKKQWPLIILSHGNVGDRLNTAWLAEILAANGYIVAAMDHWGNTWNNKIAECCLKAWERPKDVTFVIDQLLKSSQFGPYIDSNRIGFAGYSLGGTTGLWVAGAQATHFEKKIALENLSRSFPDGIPAEVLDKIDFNLATLPYGDTRVNAFLLMAPALAWLFEESSLKEIRRPVYIFATESDLLVPAEQNAKLLAKKMFKAQLKMLKGNIGHYIFLNRPSILGQRLIDSSLWRDEPGIDREAIHTEIGREAVAFFNKVLIPNIRNNL